VVEPHALLELVVPKLRMPLTAGILVYSAVEVLGLHEVDVILSMCKVLVVDSLPRVARSRRAALGKVMYTIYW
jgi:hypothetical protein